MKDTDFFSPEDLGTFTFSDLLKEKAELLRVVSGNGFLARRVRVFVDRAPEMVRRMYIHKDSNAFVKWIVNIWSVIMIISGMISPPDVENVPKSEDLGSAEKVEETVTTEEQNGEKKDPPTPKFDMFEEDQTKTEQVDNEVAVEENLN